MPKINMPTGASEILDTLIGNGYDAYIVGGCVRDSLLGMTPKDWDICTSATPNEVESCLSEYRILETGIKHGTVTVLMDDGQYEVTTFREDGEYSDNRRPDTVKFVTDIRSDLSRRDFTINAMAYNDTSGVVDPFNGVRDLENRVISCVGNADDRFNEDALRIMRALRFASVYGFAISESTSDAIHRNRSLLNNIAVERVNTELCKLICGRGVLDILLDYNDVITTIIPEFKPCVGFAQNNKYHSYTVYDHIAHAVSNYDGNDLSVKVALLLHDIGKPSCYTEDANGGHFYGHGLPSSDIAASVVSRLKFDNKTQKDVKELVLFHDATIEPTVKSVRRWLHRIGAEQLFRLLDVRLADILAYSEGTQTSTMKRRNAVKMIAEEIIASEQCFKMKDLAINGFDIMSLGVSEGEQVGQLLQSALSAVIDGALENKREVLLEYIRMKKEEN